MLERNTVRIALGVNYSGHVLQSINNMLIRESAKFRNDNASERSTNERVCVCMSMKVCKWKEIL